MAVYDARYDIRDAMRHGYLQSAQIDANGHTSINVGLSYYKYLDRPPVYKYGTLKLILYIVLRLINYWMDRSRVCDSPESGSGV